MLDTPQPETGVASPADPADPAETDPLATSVADSPLADPQAAGEAADAGDVDAGEAEPGEAEPGEADTGEAEPGSGRRGGSGRLEEEGEVAADYLEELLDIADLDGDIDIDVENGRASVAIVAPAGSERSLRRLVGAQGEVLDALQELTRLAVQAQTGERSRLMLDIAGHRAARRRELVATAQIAVQQVREQGQPVRLDPMNPFERKVIHDAVAEAGLVSESEGEEPQRRVVVLPGA